MKTRTGLHIVHRVVNGVTRVEVYTKDEPKKTTWIERLIIKNKYNGIFGRV